MSGTETALVPVDAQRTRLPALRADQTPTQIQKAAIILTAIGPDTARGFLRNLGELDMQRFVNAIASLGKIGQDVLDVVIFEFLEELMQGPELAGGVDAVRKLLTGILDESQLDRLLDGIGQGQVRTIWARMNETPIPALTNLLHSEHPQTTALIVSELRPEVAAGVLERLDRALAQTIVMRLSRVPAVDPEVGTAIQDALERDFLSALQRNLSKRRPAELIAALMNNISTEVREGFLGHLEKQDAALAQDVQRTMFTFDDIASRVPARDIAAVVRDVEEETLLIAIKLGQAQKSATVGFILDNLPRRLSERYVEDVAAMDPVNAKEGEMAQIELTKVILAQAKAGLIRLIDKETV